ANTWYFATLRHWHAEQLPRRRLLIVDEAHNLEGQLVSVYAVRFTAPEMKEWFGGALPRLDTADEYRPLLAPHVERLDAELEAIRRALEAVRPPDLEPDAFLQMPPPREEAVLLEQRDAPVGALSRATLPALEPALFAEIVSILGAHPRDKGLIHVASYAVARRLMADVAQRAPAEARRLIFVESSDAKAAALERHRASPAPT